MLRKLNGKKDRVRLSAEILKDIQWWITYINNFNGKSVLLDEKPITCVYTDACNTGSGAVFGSDWVYCNWRQHWPAMADLHINHKETLAVVLAALYFSPLWVNKRIYILSYSTATVGIINRCSTREPRVMETLRYLFWLSVRYNFHITARHVPSHKNGDADCVSRLHEPGNVERLPDLNLCH